MLYDLIQEAENWLGMAKKLDENWWTLRGESEGICLSINLEHEINRMESFYDMDRLRKDVEHAKKLRREIECILWG